MLWISDPISGCSWIPDSTDRHYFDSGFRITLHEATYGVFSNNCESRYVYYFYGIQNRLYINSSVTCTLLIQTLTNENSQMIEMLYAVRCLKSNEDMILALAGQFKQLCHEPEKFR